MKALLIIDMQLGSFRPYSARHDTPGLISRINFLSAYFRKHSDKVIFIQHDGTKENAFLPGSMDWALLPELEKKPEDSVVSKTANDAFYQTDLETFLKENSIHELCIMGCASDFCVDATVKSALSKDFKITVVADGHTTADRPYVNAVNVIKHYNWLWSDLTPTKYKIQVVNSEDLLNSRK